MVGTYHSTASTIYSQSVDQTLRFGNFHWHPMKNRKLEPRKSLLQQNQAFPKSVFLGPGRIWDEDGAEEFLSPSQVTFLEVLEGGPDFFAVGRRLFQAQLLSYFGEELPPAQEPTTVGSGWLLSGQDNFGMRRIFLENRLLEKPIDREKMRFIWEIGRVAQTKPGALTEILKAATYFAAYELFLREGRLDEAYVFALSTQPANTRLYLRYGMELYSRFKDSEQVALVIPLSVLLSRYPPEQFTSRIGNLKNLGNLVKSGKKTLFTLTTKKDPGLLIQVRSFADEGLRAPQRQTDGLNRHTIFRSELTHAHFHRWADGSEEPRRKFLERERAFEITVLQPKDLTSQVVRQVLVGVFNHLKRTGLLAASKGILAINFNKSGEFHQAWADLPYGREWTWAVPQLEEGVTRTFSIRHPQMFSGLLAFDAAELESLASRSEDPYFEVDEQLTNSEILSDPHFYSP